MSAPVESDTPDAVVTQRDPGIMVITINRPDQRNAMTKAAAHIIADALRELDSRSDLGAAVITGAGGSFCAGMDLKRFAAGELPRTEVGGFAGFVEAPPKKPIIAAVEGWALGGGFEIVLACDLVVAAAGARFGLPEVRRGLIARGGGVVRLPRRLPRAIALEAILTGEPLSAQTAASFGMVNTVVPDGDALDAAVDLARRISVNAPLAVAVSKQIVDESEDWPQGELFSRQQAISDPVFTSHDAAEGAAAFAQKRAPVWTGR